MYERTALGDTWTPAKSCPQMNVTVPAAAFVLNNATSIELGALEAVANDADTKAAIRTRNADALGWHLAGGDDCQVGTTAGKAFNLAFTQLQEKIEARTGQPCDVDPATGMYTCPGIDVTVPGGGGTATDGMSKYLPWMVLAGVALLLAPKRRR